MNLKINKVFKYLITSILTTSILTSCNRYVEPTKVNITPMDSIEYRVRVVDYIRYTNVFAMDTTISTIMSMLDNSIETTTTAADTFIINNIDDEDNSNSINVEYPRIPELSETTKTTTNATTTTSTTVTTTSTSTTISETTTVIETKASSISFTKEYIKTFSRGTYYCYGKQCYGGSGRSLIDCSVGDGTVKGSVASSYLYNNYGYNYNGERTMIYLEINGYPDMNGYYYLDDCDAGNSNVIDFFYIYGSNCPFCNQGVVTVDCYMVKQD